MADTLTLKQLRDELRKFPNKDDLTRTLNDRFEHYEKRQDKKHEAMMAGFAQVVEDVNNHTTKELEQLRRDLDVRKEFDHLAAIVAERFGLSVGKLTGRRSL